MFAPDKTYALLLQLHAFHNIEYWLGKNASEREHTISPKWW